MMTEEDANELEMKAVEHRIVNGHRILKASYPAILAAYRELKERREGEEWLHKNAAMPVFYRHGVNMRMAGEEKIYEGPTLHAAITAARGE